MGRSGSPRLSPSSPSMSSGSFHDDESHQSNSNSNSNLSDQDLQLQQQLQDRAAMDQHAASLLWTTLLAMLDQICVETSPLQVLHKFFMSLSNLIKLKPNLDQDLLEIMATVDSPKILQRACAVLTWIHRPSVGHPVLARPLTPIDYDTAVILQHRHRTHRSPSDASSKRHWRRKSLSSMFSNDRGSLPDDDLLPPSDSTTLDDCCRLATTEEAPPTVGGRSFDFLAGHDIYPVMFPKASSSNDFHHHHRRQNKRRSPNHPLCERCDQRVEGFGAYCYVCDSSLHWDCYHKLRKLAPRPTTMETSSVAPTSTTSTSTSTSTTTASVAASILPAIGTNYVERPPTSRWQLYSPDLDGCRLRGEHQLVLVNLFSTLLCYVCRRPLWGHQHQAYRCQGCCQFMHARCHPDSHRYAEECLQDHHGDIPTTTSIDRVVESFRGHYQELIQAWRECQGMEGDGEGEGGGSEKAPTTTTMEATTTISYEEASTIYSVLAVQVELLWSAISRQELRIAGVNCLDDLKKKMTTATTGLGQRLDLFNMMDFFEKRVEALWRTREWSVDLADYFEDDEGQVADGMPAFLLFHSGYWRHFGSMVKTLLLESSNEILARQHPLPQQQNHHTTNPFGFGDHSYGGNSGGGISAGSSSASMPAALSASAIEDLAAFGFEIDAVDLIHHQQEDYNRFRHGSEVTHCHSLVSIFRFCSQRLGTVSRWSLRQILQAWINMGILERQDGSLILFEQGTAAAKTTGLPSLSSSTDPSGPSGGGDSGGQRTPIYRSVPCLFPVVSALDPSAHVETLIQTIWRCLESEDLSLNECGFQLLVRRCAPDPFMSDYSTERLVGAVFYWLLLEDDHMAHVLTHYYSHPAQATAAATASLGVRPGIVQQVSLKRKVLLESASSSSNNSSSATQVAPTNPSAATDMETVSGASEQHQHQHQQQQRQARGAGGLLTTIGCRIRGGVPPVTVGATTISQGPDAEKHHQQQHQHQHQYDTPENEHSPRATGHSSDTTSNPYLLTRRLLMERYALPWLEGIKDLDSKSYLEMAQRQIIIIERELGELHTNMENEKLLHDQLERSFECIVRLRQSGFLFDLFPGVLQYWQDEAMACLSGSVSKDGVLPEGFQSLHRLFFESQDLAVGDMAPRPWISIATAPSATTSGGSWPASKRPVATTHTSAKSNPLKFDAAAPTDAWERTAKAAEVATKNDDAAVFQVLRQAEKGGSDGISKVLTWIELFMASSVAVPATAFKSCSEMITRTARSDQIYNPVNDSKRLLQLCWEQIVHTSHSISDKDAYEIVTSMLLTNVAKIRTSKQVSYSSSADGLAEIEDLRALVRYALALCMCIYGCPIPYTASLEMTPTETLRTQKKDAFDYEPHVEPGQMKAPRDTFMNFLLPKHRLDKQDNIIGIFLDSLKSPVLDVGGEVIAAFAALFDFGCRIDNIKGFIDSVSEALIVKIWDMLLPQNDHLVDTALPLLMRCVASKPNFLQEMVEKQFAAEDWELRFIQLDHVFGLFSKMDDAFAMKILFQHSPMDRPKSPTQHPELYFKAHDPMRILGYLGPLFSCMVSCMWDKKDAVRTKSISLLQVFQPVQVYYALKAWEIYFVTSPMDVQQELCRLMTGLNNQFPGWRIMSYGLIFDLLTVKKSMNPWDSSEDGGVSRRASLLSFSQGDGSKQAKFRSRSNSVASVASLASNHSMQGGGEKQSSRLAKLRKKLRKKEKVAVPINIEAKPTRYQQSITSAHSVKSSSSSAASVTSSLRSGDSENEMDSEMDDDQLLEHLERQEELAREDDLYCSLINLALQMVANGIEPTLNEVIQLKYLVVFYLDFEDCELLNIGDGNQQVHFGQYVPHHGTVYDPGHETFVLSICSNLKLILDRYVEIRPDNEHVSFGNHPLSSCRSTSTLGVNASGLSTTAGGGSSGVEDGAGSVKDPFHRCKSQEQLFRDYVAQQQYLQHHCTTGSGCASSGSHTCAAAAAASTPAAGGESDIPDQLCDQPDSNLSTHRSHRRHYHQQNYLQRQHEHQHQRHIFQRYQKFYNRRDRKDENAPVVGTYFVDVILRFFGAEPDLAMLPTERLKNWLELFLIVIYKYVSEQDQLQDYIIVLMRKVVDMLMMKRPHGSNIVRLDDDYVAKENILLGISICHTLLRRSVKMTALILSREIMAMGRLMTRRRDDPDDPVRIKARDFLRDAFEMFLGNGLFLLVFKNHPVPKDAWLDARVEDDYYDDDSTGQWPGLGGQGGQGHDADGGAIDHQEVDLFFVLNEVLGETEMVPQDPSMPNSQLVLLRDQPIRDVLDRVIIFKDLQPLQVSRILTNLWLYVERVHSSFHDPKIMADFAAFFIKLNKYMTEWGNHNSHLNNATPAMASTISNIGTATATATAAAGSSKSAVGDRATGTIPAVLSQGKTQVDSSQIQQLQEQFQKQQQMQRVQLDEKQAREREAATGAAADAAAGANGSATDGAGQGENSLSRDSLGLPTNGALTTSNEDPWGIIRQESMSTTTTVMTPQAYLDAMQWSKTPGETLDEKAGSRGSGGGGGGMTLLSSQDPQSPPQHPLSTNLKIDQDDMATKDLGGSSILPGASNAGMPTTDKNSTALEAQAYATAQVDRILSGSTDTTTVTGSARSMEEGKSEQQRGGAGLFGLFSNVREYFSGGQQKTSSHQQQQRDDDMTLNGSVRTTRDRQQKQQQLSLQPSHPHSHQPPSRFGTVMSTIRPILASDIRYGRLYATTQDIANPVLRMCAVLMVRTPSEALVLVPSLKVLLRQALYRDALSPETVISICSAYAFMAELDLSLDLTNAFGEVVVDELKAVIKGTKAARPMACNLLLAHHLLEWQANPALHPRWTVIKAEYLGKMRFPPGQPVLFPGATDALRKESTLSDTPPLLVQQASAWQFCRDPEGWGPFNPARADFTPCAEHTLLFGLPAVVAIILFWVRIRKLQASHVPAFRFGRTEWIYWSTQLCIVLGISALLTSAVSYLQLASDSPLATPTFLFGVVSMTFAWTTALFVNADEHKYTTRSSDHLFLFYVYTLLAAGLIYLTLDSTTPTPTPDDAAAETLLRSFKILLLSLALGLVIEASPRTHTQVQVLARQHEHQTIENQANLYSRVAYHYLDPLMKLGAKQPLQEQDVPELVERQYLTSASADRIGRVWKDAIQRHEAANKSGHDGGRGGSGGGTTGRSLSLLWTIFNYGRARIVAMTMVRVVGVTLRLLTPMCMKYLLLFIQQRSSFEASPGKLEDPLSSIRGGGTGGGGGDKEGLWPTRFGVMIAVGILVLNVVSAIATSYSILLATVFGMEVRSALIQLIYLKSLVLSPQARQVNSVGSIVNRMSVDADKWVVQFQMMPMLFSLPLELGFALFLLYRTVGISCLAGVAVILLQTPIQGKMGEVMSTSEDEKLGHMDNRIRLMTEIVSSIKIIKLYGWDESFRKKVGEVRRKEMVALRRMTTMRALLTIVFSSTTLLMALATFTCYALIGGPGYTRGKMTADVVFVAITLFGMISTPMGLFSHCYKSFVSMRVSNNRIQEMLLADELEHAVDRFPRSTPMAGETPIAIEIHNATLAWTKDESSDNSNNASKDLTAEEEEDERQPLLQNEHGATTAAAKKVSNNKPTLRNINLVVAESTLTAIVGRVGQGKSSLLAALTGEMCKRDDGGSVRVYGTIAYVPQQAWIIHGTLRDNILFGKPFRQAKYDQILHAAGLLPDLAMLPAGDMTEIGERGINLSGGQKQRVSLARAAYQEADIYLMDDPLSAVDAHVDQHLWEHLIGPDGLLHDKTRLLVTHGIHHLDQVDNIVLLKDGEISEKGRYYDLLDAQQGFYQLIRDYQVSHNADAKKKKTKRSKMLLLSGTDSGSTKDDAASQHSADTKDSGETQQEEVDQAKTDKDDGDNDGDEDAGALTQAEKMSVGLAGWRLYRDYARACSYRNVVFVLAIFTIANVCHVGTNIWLKHWIDSSKEDADAGREPRGVSYYLSFYAFLVLIYLVLDVAVNYVTEVTAGMRAAAIVHDRLLHRVLRLPMAFFDTTPMGRVINRFSSDTAAIDDQLAEEFNDFFAFVFKMLTATLVIALSTPAFLLVMPPAIFVYILVQTYFIKTSSSIKKICQVTKSPVYSHFAETLVGVSSIRVMDGAQTRFIAINVERADKMAQRMYTFSLLGRWLQVRLETLGAVLVCSATLLAVLNADHLDPSLVGLALSYALNVTSLINFLVRTIGSIQNIMVNFERIQEYSIKPTEAPAKTGVALPDQWPQQGHIVVRDYSTRYREGLDLVLKHVSFEVLPAQKIGIVGRTGAGKSSLTLALFRLIEAANSFWAKAGELGPEAAFDAIQKRNKNHRSDAVFTSGYLAAESEEEYDSAETMDGGSIEIDGLDIATMGLDDLRQHLAIIPQDPTLFAGTLRENLDPFGELEDVDLWQALERAHLKGYISSLGQQGLQHEVAPNGENFSVGQRQLICLARALLRKTKVLVLDEATSSVDIQTDELIQKTIRTEFRDRTILTIAHRIKSVMDYDKILVLDHGQVQEYASPKELLQKKESLFYGLAKQAGEV
ncbi:Canalicular multispecific organic anion transporter 2 [Actinomortierella ambigua]|uniref:Canalicular multispecific organic anion transporter 2 n=1 Tax=Actinomortierella ambigua TaxID=1343610 RepID=A0A9P6UDE1_9FUNG|nr:Canalicular multispecific organic anion transporter 2 [Actinomortierella ambigua]